VVKEGNNVAQKNAITDFRCGITGHHHSHFRLVYHSSQTSFRQSMHACKIMKRRIRETISLPKQLQFPNHLQTQNIYSA